MSDNRIILDANLGRTNIIDFDTFSNISIDTLTEVSDAIIPLCGVNALQNLVIYKNLANQYLSNVFSNDGIHILKSTEYMSPIQTYITNYIRYIAERVEKASSDGTSTAIYLASNLLIGLFREVRGAVVVLNRVDNRDKIDIQGSIMHRVNFIATQLTAVLNELKEELGKSRIDINSLDEELKRNIIFNLAFTTSKRNKVLTDYAVDLFMDLPELLYEHTNYTRSSVETDEDFTFENPEHDLVIKISPSNNTKYNSKLNTELLLEECDLLVVPAVSGVADTLINYLKEREANYTEHNHLIVLFTGADDHEHVMLETNTNSNHVTLCRHQVFHPAFVNNPLELNMVRVVCGGGTDVQFTKNDFKRSVIKNIKCRIYDKSLYLYRLFDYSTTPLHPSYVNGDNQDYNKLRIDLEERITQLRAVHNKTNVVAELNEFVRIYRLLICSKLPLLTIGGSTVSHLSNVNIVDDVLGVVSVAMKNGVILDMIPKLWRICNSLYEIYPSEWLKFFVNKINDFTKLTYQNGCINTDLNKLFSDQDDCKNMLVGPCGKWNMLDSENIDMINVVQSYKSIDETISRLIETIPKLICTTRVLVPDGVMGEKSKEQN